jgi:hypothetical protein
LHFQELRSLVLLLHYSSKVSETDSILLNVNNMKIIGYFIIAFAAISCIKPGENRYSVKFSAQIEIKQTDIPETCTVNQVTHIMARAEQPNGCWSNLNFVLTKQGDQEYLLEAFGVYESSGACSDVIVYGDTTIAFTPTLTGKYIFHISKSETETLTDTLTVAGSN